MRVNNHHRIPYNMAGFLSKFARGAAGQGAALYADKAKAEMMAELTAKRDAVLNTNRNAATQQSQEFTLKRDEAAVVARQDAAVKSREANVAGQEVRKADRLEEMQAKHKLDVARDTKKVYASGAKKDFSAAQKAKMLTGFISDITKEQSDLSVIDPMGREEIKAEALQRMNDIIGMATGAEAQVSDDIVEAPKSKSKVAQILADNPDEDPRTIFRAVISNPNAPEGDKEDARQRLAKLHVRK